VNGERTLRILHISDLHARGKRDAKRAWKRTHVLGDAWRRNIDEIAADGHAFDLVAFTGDIADWGLPDEYAAAMPFVDELCARLAVPRERFFVVPGNHDVQRQVEEQAWARLREGIWTSPQGVSEWMADSGPPPFGFDPGWRDAVLQRASAFWGWVERDLGRADLLPAHSPHGRLGYRVTLPGGGQPVHVIGLDSAWLAGDDADAGRLWLTDDQIGLLGHDPHGWPLAGFRLVLVHHPLTDLADADSSARLLGDTVDLLLRGHQHTPIARAQTDPDRTFRELAAGCLYEGAHSNRFPDACQVIDVVLDATGRPLRYDIRFRAWSPHGHWYDDGALYREARNGRLSWVVDRARATGAPVAPAGVSDSGAVPRAVFDSEDTEPVELDAELPPPPYRTMAQTPAQGFVERHQLAAIVELLTAAPPDAGACLTVALRGSGGFGKTTLAQAVCADEAVRQAFPDGVLWTTLGEDLNDAERLGRALDLMRWWAGEEVPSFTDANAAGAELRQRLTGLRVLLVVDDVWQSVDLAPFLGQAPGAAVLITTRDRRTLPEGCAVIDIDAMRQTESVGLLGAGLGGRTAGSTATTMANRAALAKLAARLGHWPLLLGLVNRQLRELVEQGLDVPEAIAEVEQQLANEGLTAFDVEDDEARRTAVERTMAVSLQRLDDQAQQAYERLAVFPEDSDVPLSVLARYWSMDVPSTRKLCARLHSLSLLQRFDVGARTIRLHDVFRHYLIDRQGPYLPALHREWLAVFRPGSGRWLDLPGDEPYAWRFLAYHLRHAERGDELAGLLFEFDWLEAKLQATGVPDLLADFEQLLAAHAAGREAGLVRDALRLSGHVLGRDPEQLPGQLVGRLLGFARTGDRRIAHLLDRTLGAHDQRWLCPTVPNLVPPGGPLLGTLAGHELGVRAVAVTPDGRWVVSASEDRTLKLWDLAHGVLLRTLGGHRAPVRAVAVTPDGRHAISASYDRTLKLWDLEQGGAIHTLSGHTDHVLSVAITPDGARAVSASHDRTLKLWDLERGVEIRTLSGHRDSLLAVAITPDGQHAVSASYDRTLKLWDLERGTELRTLSGHAASVSAVAVTPDGRYAISASTDRTLKVWDLARGAELRTLSGHAASVLAVAVTPDGQRAVSASEDQTLRLWDLAQGQELGMLSGHASMVWGVAVTPDGKCAVSASEDRMLKIWGLEEARQVRTLGGHGAGVSAVAVTPDGRRAISAGEDRTLKVWDLEHGTELRTLSGHAAKVLGVAVTPDGKYAVSASQDRLLKLWDLEQGVELATLAGHTEKVMAVAITPGGKHALSASEDRTLKLWSLEKGTEVGTLSGHDASVGSVAITPDGKRAVSASSDRLLKIWDLKKGSELATLSGHELGVRAVAITPDGKRAVSAAADKTLRLWDLDDGRELRTISGHEAAVRGVAITPDGKRAASASADGTLRLWDLESGTTLVTFTADGAMTACAIAPSGRLFVAGDSHGRLHVLELVEPT
jgi:WD40 repeat protein